MVPEEQKNEIIEIEPVKQGEAGAQPGGGGFQQQGQVEAETGEVGQQPSNQFSIVASTPQHKKVMVIAIVAIAVGALYYIFFGRPVSEQEAQDKKEKEITAQKEELLKSSTPVTEAVESTAVTAPKLPEPLPLTEPTPPEPPPPPIPVSPPTPSLTQTPQGIGTPAVVQGVAQTDAKDLERQKKVEAKRKAGMIILGGSSSKAKDSAATGEKKEGEAAGGAGGGEAAQEKKKPNFDFLGFGNGSLESTSMSSTSAEQVRATKIGNTDYIVAQGKVINAVLETAINTDLPGTLRAVITRDVYAESGKNILIPKGSRIVGSYDSEVKDGQTRVSIMWDRIIRPDGIDIAVASGGTDQLGRSGVAGKLDTKFWTRIGTAFLVSYIIPIVAARLAGAKKSDSTSTTTTTGSAGTSTTSTASVAAQQAQEAADKFEQIAGKAVESAFPIKPTITVVQGTRVNIFVKKDLVFPSAYTISSMQVMK